MSEEAPLGREAGTPKVTRLGRAAGMSQKMPPGGCPRWRLVPVQEASHHERGWQ